MCHAFDWGLSLDSLCGLAPPIPMVKVTGHRRPRSDLTEPTCYPRIIGIVVLFYQTIYHLCPLTIAPDLLLLHPVTFIYISFFPHSHLCKPVDTSMQTTIDHLLCLPTLLNTNPPSSAHKYLFI